MGNDPVSATDPHGKSLYTKLVKFVVKGGDLSATFAGNIEDIGTLTDPGATTGQKLIAAASLASEALPVSMRDAKEGAGLIGKTFRKTEDASVPNSPTRRASRPETPYPDATGRYHGDIPDSVPREWKVGEVDDAIDGLQRSINQRKREIRRFGDNDKLPGHIEKLRREENFLKQLQKRRGEIGGS